MYPLSTNNKWQMVFIILAIFSIIFAINGPADADQAAEFRANNLGQNRDNSKLEARLKMLEREVALLSEELGRNRTIFNISNEAKALATDAWTVAIEARSIAVRAEEKADKLQNEKR